jgi:hypothetical protein
MSTAHFNLRDRREKFAGSTPRPGLLPGSRPGLPFSAKASRFDKFQADSTKERRRIRRTVPAGTATIKRVETLLISAFQTEFVKRSG